ncbi:MBL fold metallo-hydrolase [Fervidibacillus halotolerans]|uniref:MBL fold metallo-hydrolase n=1 Tax=Fervidibacillus halotolerans TaxID=2980027 RepID=A0A9E8M1K3_9BACI|nr:MBL fold metallo-hydrolase [Fervidibacillus halotolerans]WAA13838.1 MBL fold metallo-hydrolase [Fervidibacillus halotolerans]
MAEWIGDVSKITLPTPFPVGDVNVYLIKGEMLTLIDAGVKTQEAWEKFLNELQSLQLQPSDIEQVVLTHHHPDHIGFLDHLKNIPVFGHRNAERWLIRDQSFLQEYRSFYLRMFHELAVPKKLEKVLKKSEAILEFGAQRKLAYDLKEGMEIPGLPGWFVVETLGHAQSHISLYNEKRGVMIGGDHLLATISSNPILEPPIIPGTDRPKPQLQYNDSLKKIKEFSIHTLYTGHGKEIFNVSELVSYRLLRQHERAMKVKEMLDKKALTGFEICSRLFPKACESELNLAISETVGQLDYLTSLGEIVTAIDYDGTIRYTVA